MSPFRGSMLFGGGDHRLAHLAKQQPRTAGAGVHNRLRASWAHSGVATLTLEVAASSFFLSSTPSKDASARGILGLGECAATGTVVAAVVVRDSDFLVTVATERLREHLITSKSLPDIAS